MMSRNDMALECYSESLETRRKYSLESIKPMLMLINSMGEAHLGNKSYEKAECAFVELQDKLQ